jgi:hypothetical protein
LGYFASVVIKRKCASYINLSLRNPPISQQDKDKQKSTAVSNNQTDKKITGGLKQSPY